MSARYMVEARIAGRIARTTTDTEAQARACARAYLAEGAEWVHVTRREPEKVTA